MPAFNQLEAIEIVLVSPRNPLNIGAAARAMANFGFERLTVVAPFDPHWQEARSAVGAEDLLQNATRAERLADAVADCTLVLGTGSLGRRAPEQPVVPLPGAVALVREELARGGRVALVFGPEKHGLTRDDLVHCHRLIEIPTHPRQPSMNLGQAVAVCLYEFSTRLFAPAGQPQSEQAEAARSNSAQIELLAAVIEQTMDAVHYSPAAMRTANRRDVALMLRRLALGQRDARRILGFFRRILHRLAN